MYDVWLALCVQMSTGVDVMCGCLCVRSDGTTFPLQPRKMHFSTMFLNFADVTLSFK